MSFDYEKVCQILKEAVPLAIPPNYKIDPEATCHNDQLLGKVNHVYKIWTKGIPETAEQDFRCVGSCEIGDFNGNEITRIFYDIFKTNQYQIGNYVCFSSKNKQCFAIIFLPSYSRPMIATLSPPSDSKLKHVYNKLFDDEQVKEDRKKVDKEETTLSQVYVENLRKEAKVEYFQYLETKFANFNLHPFDVAFIGLSADIATHSCKSGILLQGNSKVDKISFAACVRLAFKFDQTGEITKLFGEVGLLSRKTSMDGTKQKADIAVSTTNQFIAK